MTPEEVLEAHAEERFGRLSEPSQAAVLANGHGAASRSSCIEWCENLEAQRNQGIAAAMAQFKPELFYPSMFLPS